MFEPQESEAAFWVIAGHALTVVKRLAVGAMRRYNRLEVEVDAPLPDLPSLIVSNHGFSAVGDLNVLALLAVLDDLDDGRPVIILTHQMAWTVGMGKLVEQLGAREANPEVAIEALTHGHHVVVFPGGDRDASKDWAHRNRVSFFGRSGFARVAMKVGAPIVPVVTAGAGESLLVLNDGRFLAEALRLDRLLRADALPISVSIPWGLSVGVTGVVPYLPLPTKVRTAVLPAIRPRRGDTPERLARRVEAAMQQRMTRMTENRKPLLG